MLFKKDQICINTYIQGGYVGIIKDAVVAHRAGNFSDALNLYQEAGRLYGESLFYANVILCKRAIKKDNNNPSEFTPISENINIIKQLSNTQSLLEYYFNRSEKLEAELLNKA